MQRTLAVDHPSVHNPRHHTPTIVVQLQCDTLQENKQFSESVNDSPLVNYSPEENNSLVNQWMIPQWWTIHLRRKTVKWISEWFRSGELFTWGEQQLSESVNDSPTGELFTWGEKQLSESVSDSAVVNYSPEENNSWVNQWMIPHWWTIHLRRKSV